MHIKRITILLIYLCLLPACSANAESQLVKEESKPLNDSGFIFAPIAHANTAELLKFIADYEQLNKEEQGSAYMKVMQDLAENKNVTKSKIKQAAILAIPSSSLRDTKLAQQQLDTLLADASLSDSNMTLVKLLHAFTLDHNKQKKKTKEAASKANSLKLKNKALSRQLNEIKNIEKTMIERNAKANNK